VAQGETAFEALHDPSNSIEVTMANTEAPIAVISAMEAEVHALCAQLSNAAPAYSSHIQVIDGYLANRRVVVAIAGIGKVAAALASQYLCDRYNPRALLVAGPAGRVAPTATPGTAVIASAAMQHDYDARPLVGEQGMLPHLGVSRFIADAAITKQLIRACTESVQTSERQFPCIEGLVVSGDQIIRSPETRNKIRFDHPDALCVDMETAAVAQVAFQNGVPWGAIRLVSDDADEMFDADEVIEYSRETASHMIAAILLETSARL